MNSVLLLFLLAVIAILITMVLALLRRPSGTRPSAGSQPLVSQSALSATGPRPAYGDPIELAHDVVDKIDRFVADGQKIQAIKVYKDATHVGLAEAKHAIDVWRIPQQRNPGLPEQPESSPPGEWPQLPGTNRQ